MRIIYQCSFPAQVLSLPSDNLIVANPNKNLIWTYPEILDKC